MSDQTTVPANQEPTTPPAKMYTRDEMRVLFPIAYRKARQRALAEHLRNTPVTLRFGSIDLTTK